MANTLTDIMPKIIARGHMVLRKKLLMTRLVNTDYSSEAKEKGNTVDVPIYSTGTASDVTPGVTAPTPDDTAPTTVPIALNNWKHKSFHLTDKELNLIDSQKDFIPKSSEVAIDALASAINQSVFAEYKGIYGYVGTAGTTPFGSTIDVSADLKATLNKQLCPGDNRRGILNFDAEAKASVLAPFRDASASMDRNVITEGELGRKMGFDWYSDDDVPTHTAGTLSNGSTHSALVNGALSAAVKTMNIDSTTLTGTVLTGDIFTFAGHSQTYVVTNTSTLTASGNAIAGVTFEPALQVAVADNVAVTFKDTHVVNLGLHRDCIAFATRPLANGAPDKQLGVASMSIPDPKTGIVLRLEVMRPWKETIWDFDVLWGTKLIRAPLGCRLAG